VLHLLAKGKIVRGTIFDPFGRTSERRAERQLVHDYEALLVALCERLTPDRHDLALALARLPEKIRGYGPVKEAAIKRAREEWDVLLADFKAAPTRLIN
jgi:indolepyruvate ferredoxin oxidoreductase